ncbi:hypothetical protein L3Q82_006507 [Scortum barcoo]|uniref:Uncharacterized protein n=1 Tax=Scortum barcoo TaxID=214431 RepID=A0ACB8WYS0_9TELE|nr:hypothetical protein L3Q82_006507 [Scortum barcoo]
MRGNREAVFPRLGRNKRTRVRPAIPPDTQKALGPPQPHLGSTANTAFVKRSGELLTSTGDIVGRWKKYFEDLLNPTDLPSSEEAEAGDSEVDSSITQAEVTEVVRKLLGGNVPGVDEIRSNDVVLLASSGQDLQHLLGWFTAECEAARMRISTSKSEDMVLEWKRVACPLRIGGDVLPQVEEFRGLVHEWGKDEAVEQSPSHFRRPGHSLGSYISSVLSSWYTTALFLVRQHFWCPKMEDQVSSIPDANVELPDFSTVRADRDTKACGKRKGGGLALYVNKRWCNPGHVNIKISTCCRDIELLAYVDCNTRGKRTLDLMYANVKDAYRATPLPALGKADHNLVLLKPHYTPRVRRLPTTTRSFRKWSPEAEQALKDCFETTDWEALQGSHNGNMEEMVDCTTDYINFCMDTVVPVRSVRCFANNKPWITSDIKGLLNQKKKAFKDGDTQELKQIQKELRVQLQGGEGAVQKENRTKDAEQQHEGWCGRG